MRHLILCIAWWLIFTDSVLAQRQPQIVSPAKEAALRQSIPPIDDEELSRKLDEATLYTDAEMPAAMQAQSLAGGQGEGVTHFESVMVRKNGNDDRGLPTNPSREFPWRFPGGTDAAELAGVQRTFKGFWLPRRADGSLYPIVVYRGYLERSNAVNMPTPVGYKWIFPRGTLFFEVLTMRFSDGYLYTWELRTRERLLDSWEPGIYRPFPTKEHLAGRINQIRPGHPAIAKLMQTPRMTRKVLEDRLHPVRAFRGAAGEYQLPAIEPDMVRELLTSTQFVSALGDEFASDGRTVAYAASTDQREHIVPAGYLGAYISTYEGCFSCHKDTLKHADRFDSGRDWYTNLKGSDQILSWHPVEPISIGQSNAERRPVRYRAAFTASGMLEEYDPARHLPDMYRRSQADDRPLNVARGRYIVGG